MAIRVLIADDDPLIREGLEVILSNDKDFILAAAVEDGQEAAALCINRKIDVALSRDPSHEPGLSAIHRR